MFVVTTFYEIFDLAMKDAISIQTKMKAFMIENGIKGTILLAEHEGINSTISGTREAIDKFYDLYNSIPELGTIKYKESFHSSIPFEKVKVKIKKEIVAIKTNVDFVGKRGKYIKPSEWDAFISQDDVVVLDTRNDYEYYIGTFEKALNPNIKVFRDLPTWIKNNQEILKGKKIATFCTGGMRCEKLTAWGEDNNVPMYHLDGGILQYIEDKKNSRSIQGYTNTWKGYCFVFDNRIALDENLDAI